MPPKDDGKKKAPSKPECIPPIVVEALTDASLQFYLNQIADYGYRVERYKYKVLSITYKSLKTGQPSYLRSLLSCLSHRSTGSSHHS